MKKIGYFVLICTFILLNQTVSANDILQKADRKCLNQNLSHKEKKQCLKMYKKALKRQPESFEANWKMARAYRASTVYAKRNKLQNWQDICRKYGKRCMKCAKKAIQKKPNRVEGYFYYGLCIDSYSDGTSILTAIDKGLKDKALRHFKRAYQLNKDYLGGAPVLALACYWEYLPWPFDNNKKALQYYREAQKMIPEQNSLRTKLQVKMGKFLLKTAQDTKTAKKCFKRLPTPIVPISVKRLKGF